MSAVTHDAGMAAVAAELGHHTGLLERLAAKGAVDFAVTDRTPGESVLEHFPGPGRHRALVYRPGSGLVISVTSGGEQIAASNEARLGGEVRNVGPGDVTLYLVEREDGTGAPLAVPAIGLAAGQRWDFKVGDALWTGGVFAVAGEGETVPPPLFLARIPVQTITVPNPAAAAEWSQTIPAGQWWNVIAGSAHLVTSATVANRYAGLKETDGGNFYYGVALNSAITASAAVDIAFMSGDAPTSQTGGGSKLFTLDVPDMWLPPGYTIGSDTIGLSAGDQYSSIFLQVEIWEPTNGATLTVAEL